MDLIELVSRLEKEPFSLFLGAGSSLDAGGPTGRILFESVKNKFLSEFKGNSFFDLLEAVIGEDNERRAGVEQFIRDNLVQIGITDEHRYLFSLPWKGVVTTNYDHIPEGVGMTLDGSRVIKVLATRNPDFNMQRFDLLYCIKLFGDMQIKYPAEGAMVLTNADRRQAYFQKTLFNQFFDLASTSNIIYLGYSFLDSVVFDVLTDMSRELSRKTWPGFAVLPSAPSEQVKKRLEKFGINWISGDFASFVKQCKIVNDIPKSIFINFSPILVHTRSISLTRSIESNIYGKLHVLRQSDFGKSIKAIEFICSNDWNFEPYVLGYDYKRSFRFTLITGGDIPMMMTSEDFARERAKEDSADNKIFCLTGPAASGKTVVSRRMAYEWYVKQGNPVIFFEPPITIDKRMILDLMDEIVNGYNEFFDDNNYREQKSIRFLLIFEKCKPYLNEITELHNYLKSLGRFADVLLVERRTALLDHGRLPADIDVLFELQDSISQTELLQFREHFKRFELYADEQVLTRNLRSSDVNSSFFALLYTSIMGIQVPLKNSIENEYHCLPTQLQKIYAVASVFKIYDQNAYLPLVAKILDIEPMEIVRDIQRIGIPFLTYDAEKDAISTNQRIIAEILVNIAYKTNDELVSILKDIIESINIAEENQLKLLHELLPRRIIFDNALDRKLSFSEKESLFKLAISIVPTQVLIHHLSILYMHNNRLDDARKAIKNAYSSVEVRMSEPRFSLTDTEGRIELMAAKKILSDDPDKALQHLRLAEGFFLLAKVDQFKTPHPYAGLAETYLEMAKLLSSVEDKSFYLVKAISNCALYSAAGITEFDKIEMLKPLIYSELYDIGFDVTMAYEIWKKYHTADGYAFLGDRLMSQREHAKALDIINDGIRNEPGSTWLNILRVACYKNLWPGDFKKLGESLEEWQSKTTEENPLLTYELAKIRYMSFQEKDSLILFSKLRESTFGAPKRLLIEQFKDTWMEKGKPKEFRGRLIRVPRRTQLGFVECISEPSIRQPIPTTDKAIKFEKPKRGEEVYFSITFNFLGPRASYIRR